MKRVLVSAIIVACLRLAAAESGPVPIGDDAKVLLEKVSLDFQNADLAWAASVMKLLNGIKVEVSKSLGNKSITIRADEITMGEALRQFKEQTGAAYRVTGGKVLLATPDEFAAIDAGKARFEPCEAGAQSADLTKRKAETTKTTRYTVNGKQFTSDELKTAHPEIWKQLQAAADVVVTGNASSPTVEMKSTTTMSFGIDKDGTPLHSYDSKRTFSVDGKEVSEEEFKKTHPKEFQATMDLAKSVTTQP